MKTSSLPRRFLRAALALLLLAGGTVPRPARAADANPPDRIAYQGYLVTSAGVPLGNSAPANYDVVFRIYSVASAGTTLWTEKQTVTVDKGLFSVVLGEGSVNGSETRGSLAALFASTTASDRYIGFTVTALSATEVAPRLRLLTSAYAMLAKSAVSLVDASGSTSVSLTSSALLLAKAPQVTAGATAPGTRGTDAVDLQASRNDSTQVASGANSVIAGGSQNTASGTSSTAGGGLANKATGSYSVVAGGQNNQATSLNAAVLGGQLNVAGGGNSMVGGGYFNVVTVAGDNAALVGGSNNLVSGFQSFLGGGYSNAVALNHSVVAGGRSNAVTANRSFVGGGDGNRVTADDVVLVGGYLNAVSAAQSVVGGGRSNRVTAVRAVVAGGEVNAATGIGAVVGGGYANTNTGLESVIGGGKNNAVSAAGAVIGGGHSNRAGGIYSVVVGGITNSATAENAAVLGGKLNSVTGIGSMIGGGYGNVASGGDAVIAGGNRNTASGQYSTVPGGINNTASGQYSTVPGGINNTASGTNSFAAGNRAKATHSGSFVWADNSNFDASSDQDNRFYVRATGGVKFVTAITATGLESKFVALGAGDNSWNANSDRNLKKNFVPVDGKEVLEKLAAVPLYKWLYKGEDDSATPYIGPMAQDFKPAFYPGRSDKVISTHEFDGVELAAIQGLHQLVKEKDTELKELRNELKELRKLIESSLAK